MLEYVRICVAAWFCALSLAAFADVEPPVAGEQASPDLFPVCAIVFKRQCGLLDRGGHWVVEPRYNQLFASEDLWVANTTAGRLGLLDGHGKELIAPRFQTIGVFRNGLAPASEPSRDHYGYIDIQGQWIIPPRFDMAGRFVNGVAATATETDGEMRYTYIDPHGQQAVPGVYERADAFQFGLARVSSGVNDKRQVALIDLHGKVVVPWRRGHVLEPVMPDRVLDGAEKKLALLDGRGQLVFQAEGGGEVSEGRMFYTLDGHTFGLLDIETGKSLVTPRPDWKSFYASTFSDGMAWVCAASNCNDHMLALVDRQGRVVLPAAKYDQVERFAAGAAPVKYPGKGWQMIDKRGQALADSLYDGRLEPAWESSSQTPRYGDIWRISTDAAQGGPAQHWIDSRGRTLASVEHLACDIDIVRNGQGEIIWPKDVPAACAVKRKDAGKSDPADAGVSAERIAAVRHAKAQDVVAGNVDVMRREAGPHPTLRMLAGPPADLWNDPAWQHGPSTVRLDGAASLALPAGFRYLPPKAVNSLHDRLAAAHLLDRSLDTGKIPLALLAPDDATWTMTVILMPQGHVDTSHMDFDAEQLRQTMEARSTNILAQLSNARPTIHNIQWKRQPRWDAKAHRLDWSYEDFTIGGSIGSTIYLTSVTLGRRATVGMQIVIGGAQTDDRALIAQDAFDQLITGVTFDAGETYADAQPGDPRAALDASGYITGPPTKEEQEFPKKLQAKQERDFWDSFLGRLLPLLGLGLLALGARRGMKKKPPK